MYERIKRTRYAKSDRRRRYRVFFAAPADFDLVAYLSDLKRLASFTTLKGKGTNVQTIILSVRPTQLRELLEGVPDEVVVAYEIAKDP
jgi:hypothetical protein